jgi:lipocalin
MLVFLYSLGILCMPFFFVDELKNNIITNNTITNNTITNNTITKDIITNDSTITNTISCKKVKPLSTIDLTEFTKHTWYSQYQQEVKYQNKSSFFCVTATYNIEPTRKVPLFNGNVISVYNYANLYQVNGKPLNTKDGVVLCARQPNKKSNSTLLVAPCNLPNLLAGDYWIIAKDDHYNWIIVSGGQPNIKYPDGCTTPTDNINHAGLWIFSRTPIMKKEDLNICIHILKKFGYTTKLLIPVIQENCNYNDAFIK